MIDAPVEYHRFWPDETPVFYIPPDILTYSYWHIDHRLSRKTYMFVLVVVLIVNIIIDAPVEEP